METLKNRVEKNYPFSDIDRLHPERFTTVHMRRAYVNGASMQHIYDMDHLCNGIEEILEKHGIDKEIYKEIRTMLYESNKYCKYDEEKTGILGIER